MDLFSFILASCMLSHLSPTGGGGGRSDITSSPYSLDNNNLPLSIVPPRSGKTAFVSVARLSRRAVVQQHLNDEGRVGWAVLQHRRQLSFWGWEGHDASEARCATILVNDVLRSIPGTLWYFWANTLESWRLHADGAQLMKYTIRTRSQTIPPPPSPTTTTYMYVNQLQQLRA